MNTPSPRVARLNRRARILLSVAGVVLVIVLVTVALLAFDRPLLARLTGSLSGMVLFYPEGSNDLWQWCTDQGLWNTCQAWTYCETTGDVLYGVPGAFYLKEGVKGGICCNDASIGYDPAPGKEKKCYSRVY